MKRQNDMSWDRLVEALVDGELDERERVELRRQMAQDEGLRAVERALVEMRELVRMDVEIAADAVDLDGLWSRLEPDLTAHAAAIDVLTLQAYADGELEPAESARIASRLAESEVDRERLAAIAEMGGLVRTRVDQAAASVDFGSLWARLDSAVSADMEAKGSLAKAPAAEPPARSGWLDRLLAAIGGYRSLVMSVATAVVAVLVMVLVTRGSGPADDENPQALEIRVVHINEVRSSPGYNVTVDQPAGTAPVIFIRPADSAPEQSQPPVQPREQDHGLFRNPI